MESIALTIKNTLFTLNELGRGNQVLIFMHQLLKYNNELQMAFIGPWNQN